MASLISDWKEGKLSSSQLNEKKREITIELKKKEKSLLNNLKTTSPNS